MKKDISLWLRRCQFPLLLLLSVMPVLLTTLCIHAPQALTGAYLLFLAYAAAGGGSLLAPASRRMAAAAGGAAVMFALSAWALPVRQQPLLLLLPGVLTALLFFTLPLAARRYESDIPPFVYFLGVAVHVVVQFLNHYFAVTGGFSPYEPVQGALTLSLIGYMLLFLLSMNRISLDNASLGRHRIPAGMRGMNTAMTLCFFTGTLLLASFPAVIRGVTLLWHTMIDLISRFFAFLLSLLPKEEGIGAGMEGEAQNLIPMTEAPIEYSRFALLIEKIASVVTMAIIIVGSVVLARLLFKLFVRLARHLLARMRLYMVTATAEYEDEITDTREDGAQREIRFLRREKRRHAQEDRTPQGRIRQGYARLLRRRPQWPQSSTARENLPGDAAALYERARYSSHPMTQEDAERFAAAAKKTQER